MRAKWKSWGVTRQLVHTTYFGLENKGDSVLVDTDNPVNLDKNKFIQN